MRGTITTLHCLLAVALLTTACGGSPTPGTSGDGPPVGDWELRAASPAIDVPPPGRITLSVQDDEGALRAGGTAACNSYGGELAVDGASWSLDQVAVTEMGCEQPLMAAEAAYLAALAEIDTWTVDGDVLTLTGGDVTFTFDRLAPIETAALTGTTWVLDALVSGTGDSAGVSSVSTDVEPAVLRLDDDGMFTLFTGCRDFAGDWATSGGEVTLPSWGQTEDSRGVGADGQLTCGEAAEAQEGAVLAALEGGFTAEVEGDRLTVRHGESGLVLRAADDDTA